jgi:hypothetical protein
MHITATVLLRDANKATKLAKRLTNSKRVVATPSYSLYIIYSRTCNDYYYENFVLQTQETYVT